MADVRQETETGTRGIPVASRPASGALISERDPLNLWRELIKAEVRKLARRRRVKVRPELLAWANTHVGQ